MTSMGREATQCLVLVGSLTTLTVVRAQASQPRAATAHLPGKPAQQQGSTQSASQQQQPVYKGQLAGRQARSSIPFEPEMMNMFSALP